MTYIDSFAWLLFLSTLAFFSLPGSVLAQDAVVWDRKGRLKPCFQQQGMAQEGPLILDRRDRITETRPIVPSKVETCDVPTDPMNIRLSQCVCVCMLPCVVLEQWTSTWDLFCRRKKIASISFEQ